MAHRRRPCSGAGTGSARSETLLQSFCQISRRVHTNLHTHKRTRICCLALMLTSFAAAARPAAACAAGRACARPGPHAHPSRVAAAGGSLHAARDGFFVRCVSWMELFAQNTKQPKQCPAALSLCRLRDLVERCSTKHSRRRRRRRRRSSSSSIGRGAHATRTASNGACGRSRGCGRTAQAQGPRRRRGRRAGHGEQCEASVKEKKIL